ncbi:NRF domain-containing protein [Balamuthia mandrillaris]
MRVAVVFFAAVFLTVVLLPAHAQSFSTACVESFLADDTASLLQYLQGSGKYPGDWGYWDACKLANHSHYCFLTLPVNISALASASSFSFASRLQALLRKASAYDQRTSFHLPASSSSLSLLSDHFSFGPLFTAPSALHSSSLSKESKKNNNKGTTGSASAALTLEWGLCLPSTCTQHDALVLVALLSNASKGLIMQKGTVVRCTDQNGTPLKEWSTGAKVMLALVLVLVAVCLIGSTADWLRQKYGEASAKDLFMLRVSRARSVNTDLMDKSVTVLGKEEDSDSDKDKPKPQSQSSQKLPRSLLGFFLSFSLFYNTSKLVQAAPDPSLSALNGMRVLSMAWIILGHTVVWPLLTSGFDNLLYIFHTLQNDWTWQLLLAGPFAVDTFFFVSGFLLGFLCLAELRKNNNRMNWALFYFHRVWRLSPVYFFLLFVYWKLLPFLGDGPKWETVVAPNCDEHWWQNLLYIQNFWDMGEMCMRWSWYLANDMQFYVISPLVLFPFYRWNVSLRSGRVIRVGQMISWSVIIGLLIGSLTANLALYGYNDSLLFIFGDNQTYNELYNKPWIRALPYLAGLAFGLLMSYPSVKQAKLKPIVVWLLHGLVLSVMVVIVFTPYDTYHRSVAGTSGAWNTAQNTIYLGLTRLVWAILLSILTFLCAIGQGGPINWLLSHHIWTPLARLTYCAYLIHPMLVMSYYASAARPFHLNPFTGIYTALANFAISYLLAYVCFLLLERPLMNVEMTFLLGGGKQKEEKEKEKEKENHEESLPKARDEYQPLLSSRNEEEEIFDSPYEQRRKECSNNSGRLYV